MEKIDSTVRVRITLLFNAHNNNINHNNIRNESTIKLNVCIFNRYEVLYYQKKKKKTDTKSS